jgi:hypothetical protein
MRLLTFLAGMAAGVLLARRGMPAPSADPASAASRPAAVPAGDRDFPTHAQPRTDAQITERIRSQLQRTVQQPQAIEVQVRDGCVTLRGRVQARDVRLLLAEVESTGGVAEVRNELQIQGTLAEPAPVVPRETAREASHQS